MSAVVVSGTRRVGLGDAEAARTIVSSQQPPLHVEDGLSDLVLLAGHGVERLWSCTIWQKKSACKWRRKSAAQAMGQRNWSYHTLIADWLVGALASHDIARMCLPCPARLLAQHQKLNPATARLLATLQPPKQCCTPPDLPGRSCSHIPFAPCSPCWIAVGYPAAEAPYPQSHGLVDCNPQTSSYGRIPGRLCPAQPPLCASFWLGVWQRARPASARPPGPARASCHLCDLRHTCRCWPTRKRPAACFPRCRGLQCAVEWESLLWQGCPTWVQDADRRQGRSGSRQIAYKTTLGQD